MILFFALLIAASGVLMDRYTTFESVDGMYSWLSYTSIFLVIVALALLTLRQRKFTFLLAVVGGLLLLPVAFELAVLISGAMLMGL